MSASPFKSLIDSQTYNHDSKLNLLIPIYVSDIFF
jgi:hypothetical protein